MKADVQAEEGPASEKAASEIDFNLCENEEDAVNLIDRTFDDLIKEKTYPWLITKFKEFDKAYMMPVFKRKTDLSASQMSRSEFADRKFGHTTTASSAFN